MTRSVARGSALALVAALAVAALAGPASCGGRGESSPEGAFKAFSAALLGTRDDPKQMDKVYDLLSKADRRELTRRAEASRRLGGEARTGAEMLVLGRIQVAWTPKKIEVTKRSDRRAELAVTGPDRQRVRVVMVREDDGWRVSLGLAAGDARND